MVLAHCNPVWTARSWFNAFGTRQTDHLLDAFLNNETNEITYTTPFPSQLHMVNVLLIFSQFNREILEGIDHVLVPYFPRRFFLADFEVSS